MPSLNVLFTRRDGARADAHGSSRLRRLGRFLLFAALAVAVLLLPLPFTWNTRIDNTVVISVAPEQVFDYVTTPGNWPQWHPSSLAVRGATDHSARPGETATEDFIVAGRRGTLVWRVSERDAPRRWVIEGHGDDDGVAGATLAKISYTLTPDSSGTRFRRELVYPAPNLLFLALNAAFIHSRVEAESAQAVAQLKAVLERGAAPSGTSP